MGLRRHCTKRGQVAALIDYFSIALTHGLILLALWRLLFRAELDEEGAAPEARPRPWLKDQGDEEAAPDA